jgi:hypothetical protein
MFCAKLNAQCWQGNTIVSTISEENEQRQKSYPFFACEGLTSSLLHEE